MHELTILIILQFRNDEFSDQDSLDKIVKIITGNWRWSQTF